MPKHPKSDQMRYPQPVENTQTDFRDVACGTEGRGFKPRRSPQKLLLSREETTVKRPIPSPEKLGLDLRSREQRLSRRKVLGMLSAVGAEMAMSPRSFAQNAVAGPRIIDTHHHIFPPKFTARNLSE